MTDDERVDRIAGLHAYDTGCVSSGIRDPVFKNWLRLNSDETERLLKLYLVDLLKRPEYGFEDAASVVRWARDELGLDY